MDGRIILGALKFPPEYIRASCRCPDLLNAGFAARIACRHDDLAAVFEELEMMRRRNM